jgi:Rha family phage regulatory protein
MKKKTQLPSLVFIVHGKLCTDSLIIAHEFGRRHDNVMQLIEKRLNSKEEKIRAFYLLNFKEVDYVDQGGRTFKKYVMTHPGAGELIMSFQGDKATLVRIRFLDEFARMDRELKRLARNHSDAGWIEARANGKCIRSTLTSAVQSLERLAEQQGGKKVDSRTGQEGRHYYETTTRMIYKELFGDGTLSKVRERLDALHLTFLSICEESCAQEIERLCELGIDYHTIYAEAKKRVIATVEGLSSSRIASRPESVRLAWEARP